MNSQLICQLGPRICHIKSAFLNELRRDEIRREKQRARLRLLNESPQEDDAENRATLYMTSDCHATTEALSLSVWKFDFSSVPNPFEILLGLTIVW